MTLDLGIKSDPVEYRYSFEWLFELMDELDVRNLQLGSFFELYHLDDQYFVNLKHSADERGVRIRSCFTAHRELGGFFSGDPYLEAVARRSYERFIDVASILGAEYLGSNPGSVYRDRMEEKSAGIARFVSHMRELTEYASRVGISALTIEPMSSSAEPPTTPAEIIDMLESINIGRLEGDTTRVPTYVCGDISHGLIDSDGRLCFDHERLFEAAIPYMAEFHFKNTDHHYKSTFGFGPDDPEGIVDLESIREMINRNTGLFPVDEVVGYLEIGGPKLGRDYSDPQLRELLIASIGAIRERFFAPHETVESAS